jgi:hypothetical protein
MTIRTDRNQVFRDGELIAEEVVEVDITAETNGATMRERAETALESNRTFLALASPTQAQTLTEVKALARQMNGLIRLVLGQLDDTA